MGEDMIVVKAKIRELVARYSPKDKFNVAGDFADALNEKTQAMLKEAVKRAEANNRKTVMAKDL